MEQALIPKVFISMIVFIFVTLSLAPLSITSVLDNTIAVHTQTHGNHGVWISINVSNKSIAMLVYLVYVRFRSRKQ